MKLTLVTACFLAALGLCATPAMADTYFGSGGPLVDHDGDNPGIALFTINVSGTGADIASLDAITLTDFTHTWLGDTVILLLAPDNATFVLATSPPDLHSANFNGDYTFVVSNILPTIDEIADGQPSTFDVPSGSYAASDYGGGSDPGPRVDWAEMQGVGLDGDWILQIYDFFPGDTGELGGWNFTVTIPEPAGAGLLGAAASLLLVRRRRA